MPDALVDAIDQLDGAGRRKALRVLGRAAEASGFAAACGRKSASSGRQDPPTRRPATCSPGASPRAPVGWGRPRPGHLRRLHHEGGALGWRRPRGSPRGSSPRAGGARSPRRCCRNGRGGAPRGRSVPRGVPRGGMPQQRRLEARQPAQEMRAAAAQDIRRLRMGPDIMARGLRQGRAAVALLPRRP